MKRILFLTFGLVIFLCGCDSGSTSQNNKKFHLEFEIPQSSRAGQAFKAKAYLINDSNEEIKITHGVDLFTFDIRNSEGQSVNRKETMVVIGLGIESELLPKKPYFYSDSNAEPFQRLSILKPGTYYITAKANFRLEGEGKPEEIHLTSEPKSIFIE